MPDKKKHDNDIEVDLGNDENDIVVDADGFDDELKSKSGKETSDGTSDDEEDYGNWPADCYTFISLHHPFDGTYFFWFGFAVWVFQFAFLILLLLRQLHPRLSTNENDDNPEQGFWATLVPSAVPILAKATQYMALITYCVFADESLKDIVTAVETFPKFSRAKPGDNVGLMSLSCILRFSQGMMSTFVVFLLVLSTTDVIDIILNFTAVNFISAFDDVAFELAQYGKYGPALKEEADRIEELPAPRCIYRKYQHVRYRYTVIPIFFALMVFLTIFTARQKSSKYWLTTRARIQFKDELYEEYNGCYDQFDYERQAQRVLIESFPENQAQARFAYCQQKNQRKWYLYTGNKTSPCDLEDDEIVATSSKTYLFDFSAVQEETWYSRTGSPLELYFFDDNKIDLYADDLCQSFLGDGHCDEKFNQYAYAFDEGDCCVATCDALNCGVGALTEAFKNNVTSGNGYPYCINPEMVPITIQLNDVYIPVDSGLGRPEEGPNPFADLPPIDPLMILDCDGKTVLEVAIQGKMKFESQTVNVTDGAECTMTVRNTTGGLADIQFVKYTIYHGDEESIEANPIVMLQEDSSVEGIRSFRRIPECYFSKLGEYVDTTTIYTGTESSNQAIQWLMEDSKGFSNCEYDNFIERYALAVLNYAAPIFASSDETDEDGSSTELWINPERQCVWRNVLCVDGHVTEIDLGTTSGFNISGTIPTELGLLDTLQYVDLSGNQIYGTIPTQIGQWKSLNVIGFEMNKLTGTIPTELADLPDLEFLVLYENQLNGTIPKEIGDMTSLRGALLYNNDFVGPIPTEISGATSLEYFISGLNQLTGTIPSEFGLLSDMIYIESSFNLLNGPIPSEIGQLAALTYFEVGYNSLTGQVPVQLLNKNYTNFDITGNKLTDLIPVDGTEICPFAFDGFGPGEVYCNCASDCVTKDYLCGCEAALSCCTTYLEQFSECILCPSAVSNPDKYVEEFDVTCQGAADFVKMNILEFGTEFQCSEAKVVFGLIGCFCEGEEPENQATDDSATEDSVVRKLAGHSLGNSKLDGGEFRGNVAALIKSIAKGGTSGKYAT